MMTSKEENKTKGMLTKKDLQPHGLEIHDL